ncbi:C2H2-type zinc finger transcription factor [Phycomyces blakesleeanus NRRL 1555(-)]|uniref:C2H2-type zinc finger transcription factor n=1 Tax=Phycomyces blakesleeanus (strain ATCC 8743b / DSM 1359 / FGSC 10004 / NBRC 33097 / NRRL 1555) TaxID=763407 RepID=A0A162NJH1_PHYB8|nr:C2H2-type zinc finger transcription factor [Phycomyces blakesleeanus NRRL 1555(-)]OAD74778.1 C2H2-type zinc finger transcription factor [Phycomyces blakesleeanus NRRL 1555(-)]|eukprot:XP_018292818.1 C2H2-type zinc finger transcription factor [Phycomyces blakesleeanus NRRL 1555(-)]
MDIIELIHSEKSSAKLRYPCDWPGCEKSFARPSDIVRHHRTHTNDRPFACNVQSCEKRFIQRSALTVHLRTHSGERPHACEFDGCEKRFSDSSALAREYTLVTARTSVKQNIAKKGYYTKKRFLARHIRTTHGPKGYFQALPENYNKGQLIKRKPSIIPEEQPQYQYLLSPPSSQCSTTISPQNSPTFSLSPLSQPSHGPPSSESLSQYLFH